MATSKRHKAIEIGIIAEDKSDVAVISALFDKYLASNGYLIRKFVGNGCGKLKSKSRSWTEALFKAGCSHVFIFHDLDRHKEADLRSALLEKVPAAAFPNALIVIPIEELEAWLLADEAAISQVFSLKKPLKRVPNPEAVKSPKEHIESLIWGAARKRYVNSVHNEKIAVAANIDNIRRCKSFGCFDNYVKEKIVSTA